MSAVPPPNAAGRRSGLARGFTLAELLVVMAVIVGLMALIVPAFARINSARIVTNAAYTISGLLDNARSYAKANNTYTWVGFFEERSGGSSGTAGVGRVIISVVASRDAAQIYASSDTDPSALPSGRLLSVGKLTKIDNIHLAMLNANELPSRGKVTDAAGNQSNVDAAYQVGDPNNGFAQRSSGANHATFTYPLGAVSATYTFVKIIQFNPLGDATKIVDSPTPLIEIGLRPVHVETVDTASKNCAAVQVDGIGGLVRLYQPSKQ